MDLVKLGDQEGWDAGNLDVEGAVIGGIQGRDTHEGMINDSCFEARCLASYLVSVRAKPCATAFWAAHGRGNEYVDLDIAHAPASRTNRKVETGRSQRCGELRLVVKLAGVNGEIAVGRYGDTARSPSPTCK